MVTQEVIIAILFWFFFYIFTCTVSFPLLDDLLDLDDNPKLRWLILLGPIVIVGFFLYLLLQFVGIAFYIANQEDKFDRFMDSLEDRIKKMSKGN